MVKTLPACTFGSSIKKAKIKFLTEKSAKINYKISVFFAPFAVHLFYSFTIIPVLTQRPGCSIPP